MKRIAALCLLFLTAWTHAADSEATTRAKAQKDYDDRNYLKAYEGFHALAIAAETDRKLIGADLQHALDCLNLLNRVDETDAVCEASIAAHRDNWRLLAAGAYFYQNCVHYGAVVAGEFRRGNSRGNDRMVSSYQRDRVRALQLYRDALPAAMKDADRGDASEFFLTSALAMSAPQQDGSSWALQALTDLDKLPDYDDYYGYYWGRGSTGAPVDAQGNPIFHHVPASYEKAQSDGERWRWLLSQAAERGRADEVDFLFACFLRDQFDVHTLANDRWFGRSDDDEDTTASTFAVKTLADNETIAKLAGGIKRFALPQEFDYIAIFKRLEASQSQCTSAAGALGQIFENRRQYPKAAEHWQKAGNGDRVQQIVGNWGTFENCATQTAGTAASVEFRFRNADSVHFSAHAIKVGAVLEDVKKYLSSKPTELDWQKASIDDIGSRIVAGNQEQYVDREVAAWDLKLDPRAEHRDRRITVTTPIKNAGAYLVTAQLPNGNTSRIVLWLANTIIVKKPIENGQTFIYVADAATGEPVADAKLDLFGWQQKWVQNGNKWEIALSSRDGQTDRDGQAFLDKVDNNFQWLITATAGGDRFAYLGFSSIWLCGPRSPSPTMDKAFVATDRPVYRPGHALKYKIWAGQARYDDQASDSLYANKELFVTISAPGGEEIIKTTLRADRFGGVEGTWAIPADAKLGSYQIAVSSLPNHQRQIGYLSFSIEEYKKPEFEVTVEAPSEPIALGETFTATIQAKYYFGAPVTKATVHYKVTRSSHDNRWFMPMPWDWLYGRGYWWSACDYLWYPGWGEWGCCRPIPWWWQGDYEQPEVVADSEVAIGADGTAKVVVDTAIAKEVHGNTDHNYSITAEVVDESRRTIVGTGSVIAARKPFQVATWVDRGYYRAGDTITASVHAHGPDGKPVSGTGEIRLLEITYANDKPVEKEVQKWTVQLGEDGAAQQTAKASTAGQYRISCTVTDAKKRSAEGAQIFVVMGDKFDGSQFHFNDLEVINDRQAYKPGDEAQLAINSDHAGATVLLFERPEGSIYGKPRLLRLSGKSTIEKLAIATGDMPNIFVEALTIHDGKLHVETKELIVPPESRVLTVEVTPTKTEYLPGAKAEAIVKVTGPDGKPFTGALAVSIYDRSVEYISGGSNVPDIKELFWKWRRGHQPTTESSLRGFYNLHKDNETPMSFLGVFGDLEADEEIVAGLKKEEIRSLRAPSAPAAKAGRAGNGFALFAATESDKDMAFDSLSDRHEGLQEGQGQALVQPTVRSAFADTAYWNGTLTTDERGEAKIDLTMPDNLTSWKVRAWAFGAGTKVGEGSVLVTTKKNVLVRLQAPRFFVEKDEVVLSANVHNYLKQAKQTEVSLELEGSSLENLGKPTQTIVIAADGEQRVDWRVRVKQEGTAVVRMKALTDEESDAMQQSFPVKVHGMMKMEAFSAAIRPEQSEAGFTMTVPKERRPEQTALEVHFSPTLAGALVDALPYLADYPYGCTEQTLNRFLPTVITQRILMDMKLDLAAVKEKRANLNAQEIGDPQERAKHWQRFERNAVFDVAEVAKMAAEGVTALVNMQLSDGGWGWFSGWGEHSSAHTTSVVVHGLQIARDNKVSIPAGVIENGVAWLNRYQDQQIALIKKWMATKKEGKSHADDLDAYVYMVLVDADRKNDEMRDFLYRDRPQLSVYSLTLLGMAFHKTNDAERLKMIMENIAQYLKQDDENQTAWLNLPNQNYWWCWYGAEFEAHAYYLKLLAKTNPKSDTASRLVKYLLNNRKHSTYWNSTRDTALVIEAMADYLRASGEDKPNLTVEVLLDGKKVHEETITADNLFTCKNTWRIEGAALAAGSHRLDIRKKGTGPVYINSYLSNFTLEDRLTKTGLEIKVERAYFKLVPIEKTDKTSGSRGQVVEEKREKYRRDPIKDLSAVASGDLIEVELTVESKNDYEYILLEDMKAAGCEAVDVRSGYNGNEMGAYMEVRDDRICLFLQTLARGKHSLSYRVRAEIPGAFSALPTVASAMYAPELRANSDELKFAIEDKH